VCLTGKDHFIEFGKHSGMVNNKLIFIISSFTDTHTKIHDTKRNNSLLCTTISKLIACLLSKFFPFTC